MKAYKFFIELRNGSYINPYNQDIVDISKEVTDDVIYCCSESYQIFYWISDWIRCTQFPNMYKNDCLVICELDIDNFIKKDIIDQRKPCLESTINKYKVNDIIARYDIQDVIDKHNK